MDEEQLRDAVRAAQEALARAVAALDQEVPNDDLGAVAARLFRQRRKRDEAFPPGLLVEPEWDMLLLLAKARGEGREMRQIEVLNAINVPHTTGFRVIQRLEAAGLVERTTAEKVKRTNFVRLTGDGVRRLRRALTSDDAD
jgi:DNA-binding MarR family transcriptional regulator